MGSRVSALDLHVWHALPCFDHSTDRLVMASPLPFTQLVTVLPTLDLSPQLTGNAESTNYSLHYTHPAPPSLLLTSYKADDGVDGSDSLDADSFTLYAPSAHHLVPLSPTSASSLSPPHSLSSASSVSSLSSPSPPPCLRLSQLLWPGAPAVPAGACAA